MVYGTLNYSAQVSNRESVTQVVLLFPHAWECEWMLAAEDRGRLNKRGVGLVDGEVIMVRDPWA